MKKAADVDVEQNVEQPSKDPTRTWPRLLKEALTATGKPTVGTGEERGYVFYMTYIVTMSNGDEYRITRAEMADQQGAWVRFYRRHERPHISEHRVSGIRAISRKYVREAVEAAR